MDGAARTGLKRLAEQATLAAGAGIFGRRLYAGRTLILAWHNILPPGRPAGLDRSLHLPQARFAAQLDLLQRTHDIIPLGRLHEPPGKRPRAVLTFDDAYRGALTAGLEELGRRGLPATVFVAPGILGNPGLWWDRLETASGRPIVTTARARLLQQLAGDDAAIVTAILAEGGREVRPDHNAGIVTEAELVAACAGGLLSLEAHSWSHPNLAALRLDRLREELARPREWLRRLTGQVPTWVAYPYGEYSAEVEAESRQAGYTGALAISGGWVPPAPGFIVPRYNVPAGLSDEGFQLRIAGVVHR